MLEAMDLGLLYFFGGLHRPWLDMVARGVTKLGNPAVLASVGVAGMLLLAVQGQRRLASLFALICLASWGVEWGVKLFVGRSRPSVVWRLIDLPNEPSFPSGHALCSMAIYGSLGLILAQRAGPRLRILLGGGGIVLGVLIGLTRPYLGVHYPLDVFAGWTAGLALALTAAALASDELRRQESPG